MFWCPDGGEALRVLCEKASHHDEVFFFIRFDLRIPPTGKKLCLRSLVAERVTKAVRALAHRGVLQSMRSVTLVCAM